MPIEETEPESTGVACVTVAVVGPVPGVELVRAFKAAFNDPRLSVRVPAAAVVGPVDRRGAARAGGAGGGAISDGFDNNFGGCLIFSPLDKLSKFKPAPRLEPDTMLSISSG